MVETIIHPTKTGAPKIYGVAEEHEVLKEYVTLFKARDLLQAEMSAKLWSLQVFGDERATLVEIGESEYTARIWHFFEKAPTPTAASSKVHDVYLRLISDGVDMTHIQIPGLDGDVPLKHKISGE
jgi:hypothetical protein